MGRVVIVFSLSCRKSSGEVESRYCVLLFWVLGSSR